MKTKMLEKIKAAQDNILDLEHELITAKLNLAKQLNIGRRYLGGNCCFESDQIENREH